MAVHRLADILDGYKCRSITLSHSKDHLPLCMSCHERAARFLEFYKRDEEMSGYPDRQETLAAQVVCEDEECQAYGYQIPFHELNTREGVIEWKLQLRMKPWYDGFFDGDVDLTAHWAGIQGSCGVRHLRQGRPPRVRDKTARHISARLRAYVMERDNFRCRRCGHGADTSPLHIDHVVPVAKGGLTVESNLQTLCALCNGGKSDRDPHPHDLRPR